MVRQPNYPPELSIPRRLSSSQRGPRRLSNQSGDSSAQGVVRSVGSIGQSRGRGRGRGRGPGGRGLASFRASFRRRSSTETMGAMTTGARTAGSCGVMTVDMRSDSPPPPVDDDSTRSNGGGGRWFGVQNEVDEVLVQTVAIAFGSDDENDDDDDDHAAENQTGHRSAPTTPRRVRRASRRDDRHDFRTSMTSVNTSMGLHLISSNDEDPSFWGVSNRWFADAGEFVGELTGMATRRDSNATDPSRRASNATDPSSFSRTEGVEIVSAVDDDDEEEEEENGSESHYLGSINGVEEHEEIEHDMMSFGGVSSLGDTSTFIFTAMTRRAVIRGAWMISLSFMMVWIAGQYALHRSSWFQNQWDNHGYVSVFTPRRSRRYGKMKAKLADISGVRKEVFEVEESPQHKALVYLADGDDLSLNPNDPTMLIQLKQRYALAVFYFSTGGPNWKSHTYWLTGRHECGWLFVICSDVKKSRGDNNDNRDSNVDDDYSNLFDLEQDAELGLGEGRVVTGLSLYDQNLQGTIPKEIVMMEFLHVLDFGNNHLEGIIGAEFGRLQHLHKLYLENNNLKGGVEAVQWLSSLKRVNLENNQLSGTLPYDLGKLKHLEEVRMGQNQLNGKIPSSLLRSQSLTKLDLHGNELTGELVVHQASILKFLYLFNNNLSGELLPSVLCSLSTSLVDLRVNNNSFVGKIPDINCTMESLELLSFAENDMTGPIHNSLGEQIPRLRELHLYENKLLSTIPNAIFRPKNLTAVLLGNNELTGTLSASLVDDSHSLVHFYVNSNKLSGKLDDFAEATNLASLQKLRLEFNNFSGTIPKLNMMKNMELLYLYNNSLSGTLDNLGSGANLRKLKLSNNSLEGEIIPELGDLKRLEILSLNGNNLVGTLPKELQKLTALEELRVENNEISGVVPQGVCDLRKSFLEKLVSDCGGKRPEISCPCCTDCVEGSDYQRSLVQE